MKSGIYKVVLSSAMLAMMSSTVFAYSTNPSTLTFTPVGIKFPSNCANGFLMLKAAAGATYYLSFVIPNGTTTTTVKAVPQQLGTTTSGPYTWSANWTPCFTGGFTPSPNVNCPVDASAVSSLTGATPLPSLKVALVPSMQMVNNVPKWSCKVTINP